jgi:hypothetical protein
MLSEDRTTVARELVRVLTRGGHILVEVFGTEDIRCGDGQEVEKGTYLRGTGILTHYFGENEVAFLFPGLVMISETSDVRRITLGSVAGKRETIRTLLRNPK